MLVHGAYAGGFEWKRAGDLMVSHGYTVLRPTLTGQGERYHLSTPDIDSNLHIQDIVNVIQFEDLRDVVLVGHSYGGFIITGVIDRIPDRIKAAVYIDAGLPIDGEAGWQAKAGNAPNIVDGYISGGQNPKTTTATPPFNVNMPGKTFMTPISLKNQEKAVKVPTAYILTIDQGRTAEQDMFYKCYVRAQERGFYTTTMSGNHTPHMNQTANLVDLLEKTIPLAKAGTMPKEVK
jgi:pimeloyl-ACP methyl ester carboxylesterase